ncbi:acyl-CoA dehydrogenase family protein [Mesorhizobium sp. B4-1-4]|uniref:acyl-CoA dehydrogenase family protein n=1 Tax=Mesorhizobium sp. B4-1-4 TaxID=2589888 RepID=UPI0011288BDF|nr:acyl-CoA dehydrogenase family protein [Mesorhizobium sp. B4-1-4]UCI31912.1 acyl-CoA dehydrogenase family protein [Mesorhizobium sp. B4-1-4]
MDLRFTEKERAFRWEVRDFIEANLPSTTREHMAAGRRPTPEMIIDWQRRLNTKGWAVPHWPMEWGGRDWSAVKRYILKEEMEQTPAPSLLAFNVDMCGPILLAFGTEEQKRRFLPRMANLDDWWCQGFSEPGAGSDLASLKCSARREGELYVVNGQKAWTTYAQYANWMFMLVRTDPSAAKPQEGISFLLVEMNSPGITVHPTITIDGVHEVNEVFFDDVTVPAGQLVGEENRGWDCAKLLLSNERTGHAKVGPSKERIRRLRTIACQPINGAAPLIEDPLFAARLTDVEVQLKALEMTTLRVLAEENRVLSQKRPNPASSVLKIRGSEIHQAITELYVMAAGPYGLASSIGEDGPEAMGPEWATLAYPTFFNMRKLSIYGGSNEIQKTIMAKAFLGL